MKALTGHSDVILLALPPLITAVMVLALFLRGRFGISEVKVGESRWRRIALSLSAFFTGVLALGNYYYIETHHTDLLTGRWAARSAAYGVMLIAASGLILFRKSPR